MRARISGYGLATLFVLLAITLLLAERAPPILLGLGIIFAAVSADWRSLTPMPHWRLPAGLLAALCLWMLITSLWSLGGMESFTRGLRVALTIMMALGMVLAAATLRGEAQRIATRGAWIACAVLLALMVIEVVFDAPLLRTLRYQLHGELFFHEVLPPAAEQEPGFIYALDHHLYNRLSYAAVGLSIVSVPLAAGLWRRGQRALGAAALIVALAALSQVPMAAALMSALAGCAFAALAVVGTRLTGRFLAAIAFAAVIAMPAGARMAHDLFVAGNENLPQSWAHRIGIWNYVAEHIEKKPLFGWGMEAARIFSRNEEALTDFRSRFGDMVFQAIPLHPHNASLQVWFELGAVGAFLYACFIVSLIFAIWRGARDVYARMAMLGAAVAAFTIAHVSFGAWQYWWLSTLGMLGAMIVLMHRRDDA